jgi:catechol 2,3-dioxygenase-like lactoylglutathione lyase family enzyme
MEVSNIDHIVLTVNNLEKTIQFYESVLGMEVVHFEGGRVALKFGNQKINLHEKGKEFEPKAICPTLGSADLCFLTTIDIYTAKSFVMQQGVDIVEGPVERTGATGSLLSIYFRDPDNNLIELSEII